MTKIKGSARRTSRVLGSGNGAFTAHVELGFSDDSDTMFAVRKASVAREDQARIIQVHLAKALIGTRPLSMRADGGGNLYEIGLNDAETMRTIIIGALGASATEQMRGAARTLWADTSLKLPREIDGLHMMGSRTVALSPDHPDAATVHLPWRTSGFSLSPIILGTPSITYTRP